MKQNVSSDEFYGEPKIGPPGPPTRRSDALPEGLRLGEGSWPRNAMIVGQYLAAGLTPRSQVRKVAVQNAQFLGNFVLLAFGLQRATLQMLGERCRGNGRPWNC